jgi:hypothetical protein
MVFKQREIVSIYGRFRAVMAGLPIDSAHTRDGACRDRFQGDTLKAVGLDD